MQLSRTDLRKTLPQGGNLVDADFKTEYPELYLWWQTPGIDRFQILRMKTQIRPIRSMIPQSAG